MDLAIAIRIGSAGSKLKLVKDTIESIEKNIGQCSYRFIISLDPKIPLEIKEYIKSKKELNAGRFELLPEETVYWSEFINKAIKSAQDCDYFIKAHDDIILITEDFFPKVKTVLEGLKDPIGWISFDEVAYIDGHWAPPTRPGFYKDFIYKGAWNSRKMFQFHNLPDNYWKGSFIQEFLYKIQIKIISKIFNKLVIFSYPKTKIAEKYRGLLNFPKSPVKCHAPWNMFVMIKVSTLNEIGYCENWETYNALFVDEDWGLRALEKKYWNIWIPNIKYYHIRPEISGDRAQFGIVGDRKRVAEMFKKKWKFNIKPSKEELNIIKNNNSNNFIPWSIDKNSYEWDYIK